MSQCKHKDVICLNQYDLIRKYKCKDCNEIMMCSCDKEHAERFLPHQLNYASYEGTTEQEPVTLGFQQNICPECRGAKPVAAPTAPLPGATSKIKRYYWREILFETTKRFYDAHPEINPTSLDLNEFSFPEERKKIEKEVIDEIKLQHKINPKYEYNEISQADIIKKTKTKVILVNAEHIHTEDRNVKIRDKNKIFTVEEFASNYFRNQGFEVLETESVPFHVLFGIFMFLVIQDPEDEKNQIVQFGSRNDFDLGQQQEGIITTTLPKDFGSSLYYERRKNLIQSHLNTLEDINWLFEYWLEHSSDFRQYLWAHRKKDIEKAKKVMSILGLENLRKVLNYMAMDYWKNFCGWPDLLVFKDKEFFFVEAKSSKDKLSEDQKNWLLGNHEHMGFKVKIFKIGKQKKQGLTKNKNI